MWSTSGLKESTKNVTVEENTEQETTKDSPLETFSTQMVINLENSNSLVIAHHDPHIRSTSASPFTRK